jgi:hypothetical protein
MHWGSSKVGGRFRAVNEVLSGAMVVFWCFGGGLVLLASGEDGLERGKKREELYKKKRRTTKGSWR